MDNRVTIQNLAEALHLSRNTVSKALNSPSSVPASTRQRVLDMAIQMNYKSMQVAVQNNNTHTQPLVALIFHDNHLASTFFVPLIQKLYEIARQSNLSLSMHMISSIEIKQQIIPVALEECDGLIMMDVLDIEYVRRILSLGKPTVFFDFVCPPDIFTRSFDIVMEDPLAIYRITRLLIDSGYTKIGFWGEINHCLGFRERYYAYRNAMLDANLLPDPSWCITDGVEKFIHDPYAMKELLNSSPGLECFICANDYEALSLIRQLNQIGVSVPDQISVAGFENMPEGEKSLPSLTTAVCDKERLAADLIQLLLERIRKPNTSRRILYEETRVIVRESLKK